ncbi:unnamed protein product [Effrenium voratum]|nr:unnamed protein product [Effrenium voratum]
MDLMSAPPPSFNCPHCNKKVHLPKSLTPSSLEAGVVKTGPRSRRGEEEGLQPQRRKVAKVVSSTYRHGNRADFYLDGKKVALESGKWQLHEYQRRGFNVVTLDPDSQQIISAMSYDVSGSGNVAAAQLAADLNALPEGRVVLIAVRGSGMEALSGAAGAPRHSAGLVAPLVLSVRWAGWAQAPQCPGADHRKATHSSGSKEARRRRSVVGTMWRWRRSCRGPRGRTHRSGASKLQTQPPGSNEKMGLA